MSMAPPPRQEARFFFAISLRKPFPFVLRRSSDALSAHESPAELPNLTLALWVLSSSRGSFIRALHFSSSIRLKGTGGGLSSLPFLALPFFLAGGASTAAAGASGSHSCVVLSFASLPPDAVRQPRSPDTTHCDRLTLKNTLMSPSASTSFTTPLSPRLSWTCLSWLWPWKLLATVTRSPTLNRLGERERFLPSGPPIATNSSFQGA
mmetsp:Transcript_24317/g.68031  ORF Transcript_24317/g.68031 Transcript_24317/m.68031 type:complete len:207 (-) Transcript_24317:9-629(-)